MAATLRDVTNSYKFYWLLAILDHVRESGAAAVAIDELIARKLVEGVRGLWGDGRSCHLRGFASSCACLLPAQVRGAPDWKVNRRVVALAEQSFARGDAPCLYRFVGKKGSSIELHPRW